MGRVRYRYKPVLGLPDDFTVLEEIKSFCTAASCVKRFKRTRIGLIGYTSLSI
ncbi:MAG TPA: hypothetical protein GXX37_01135 [Clostridiaceae bacterium]|nr:hypothetical protein [Clostridiaceae bacterium]